jgi:hypothetical protein
MSSRGIADGTAFVLGEQIGYAAVNLLCNKRDRQIFGDQLVRRDRFRRQVIKRFKFELALPAAPQVMDFGRADVFGAFGGEDTLLAFRANHEMVQSANFSHC